ncbi:hypothetical protein SAMN04515617_10335 [Collimonas sp. OK242]|jgi:hypothetical protein|uniref:hypothetical protein n=1 Tax=Collimonas sp. OK242 TaxID=1798195 RepID=UPI00089D037F|nr:hypothetical protein [Collimonas sp. OK242]SDX33919.1 hypothetical protein SAMN04515617_10335 [Collimonas sp. OK242]
MTHGTRAAAPWVIARSPSISKTHRPEKTGMVAVCAANPYNLALFDKNFKQNIRCTSITSTPAIQTAHIWSQYGIPARQKNSDHGLAV